MIKSKCMSGKDKGVRAKVLRVMRDEGKVVVEGVNRVYKHMRKSQKNPHGGRLQKEMPIQLSNVLLVCPSCGKADAHRRALSKDDGSKHRFCKKCSAEIGQISPAKKSYAESAYAFNRADSLNRDTAMAKKQKAAEQAAAARQRPAAGPALAREVQKRSPARRSPKRSAATISCRCPSSRRSSSTWASAAPPSRRSTWKTPSPR